MTTTDEQHDSPASRFRRIASGFTDLVERTPFDAWDRAAPCEGWVARDIVGHLVQWVPAVIGRAGIDFGQGPSVDDDPAGAWRHLAIGLQQALDDATVASRLFNVGPPGEMTVANAINMLVVGDLLIHTWDLAAAVGLDRRIDGQLAAEMLAGMQPMDDMLRRSGHYGPKVTVAEDADAQTKLIAFTGRNPNWQPPS